MSHPDRHRSQEAWYRSWVKALQAAKQKNAIGSQTLRRGPMAVSLTTFYPEPIATVAVWCLPFFLGRGEARVTAAPESLLGSCFFPFPLFLT